MTRVTLNEQSLAEWQTHDLQHLRYEYDLNLNDVVIDIGAYRGEWGREIFNRYYCRVVTVEPGPWATDCADYSEVIQQAAWTHSGKLKVGGAYYYTSFYEQPAPHEYECFNINDLLAKYDDIALVKINIEGAEYVLLDHIITHGYHTRIRNLQVQFHELHPEPFAAWYSHIAGRLKATHQLTFRYPYCWENWQRINA